MAADIGCVLHLRAHAQNFPPEQIKLGADTYARHCSPCHGARMKNPEGAFDLLTFPKDQEEPLSALGEQRQERMPPWEGLFKPEEIEALWAYVVAGEEEFDVCHTTSVCIGTDLPNRSGKLINGCTPFGLIFLIYMLTKCIMHCSKSRLI